MRNSTSKEQHMSRNRSFRNNSADDLARATGASQATVTYERRNEDGTLETLSRVSSSDHFEVTASDAQLKFVDKLLNEREMDDAEYKTFRLMRTAEYCDFDTKVASGLIDTLLKMPFKRQPVEEDSDLAKVVAELERQRDTNTLNDFTSSLLTQYERRGTLSEKQVAAMIRGMEKRAESKDNDNPLPDVPAGRYAVKDNDDEWSFYKVDRPDKGRWEGYTFVKRLVASGGFGDDLSEQRLTFKVTRTILERIIEAGIEESMARYGHELGVCGACGRTLTDEESIARGIGPVCAGRLGF